MFGSCKKGKKAVQRAISVSFQMMKTGTILSTFRHRIEEEERCDVSFNDIEKERKTHDSTSRINLHSKYRAASEP